MFLKRTLLGRAYRLFVPPKAPAGGSLPLVVFLHGVGENGTDGEKHLQFGLPPYVEAHAADFPALVLAPQCKGPWKFVGEDEQLLMAAIESVRREFSVDRVYLTGLSQGGCSTFDLGAEHSGSWDALVVVCGAGYASDALRLVRTPVWIFHGERDPVVPPSGPNQWDPRNLGGRDMSKLLPHARYTEFPGAAHDIWDRVYSDPALWDWLWVQRRR